MTSMPPGSPRSSLQVARSGTVIGTGQILVAVRKQGAQANPAESGGETRPTWSRREFCLFVKAGVLCLWFGEARGDYGQVIATSTIATLTESRRGQRSFQPAPVAAYSSTRACVSACRRWLGSTRL